MLQRTAVWFVALLLVSASATAEEDVEPPKADDSEVFVFVECSPKMSYPESARQSLLRAMTSERLVGAVLGGLKPVVGEDKEKAPEQAREAGAGIFLHVKIVDRVPVCFLGRPTGESKLSVDCSVYKPEENSWKRCFSGKLTSVGSPTPRSRAAAFYKDEYDYMADQLGMVLIACLLPYKVTRVTGRSARVTVTNSTPHTIRGMTICVPYGKDEFLDGRSGDVLQPGERKEVTFTMSSGRSPRRSRVMPAPRPMISEIEFDRGQGAGALKAPAIGGYVTCVAFSPDGRTVASADWRISLWDSATGKALHTLTTGRGVTCVAFSPNGRTLASGLSGNTIKLWDVATGRELRALPRRGARPWPGHTNQVSSIAFSPDGRILASGSFDKTIKLWNVATGRELRTLKTIKLWNVTTDREFRILMGSAVHSVAFSPDGRTLASGNDDNSIKLWDVATGRELRTLSGHTGSVQSVAFSPDGKTLASGGGWSDMTVRLWEVATGSELRTLTGHTRDVNSVAFSPDGRTLSSGSDDETVKLWDIVTGRELRTLAGHGGDVLSVAFRPDGKTLLFGIEDGTIRDEKIDRWLREAGVEVHLTGQ